MLYRTGHGNLSKRLADRVDTAISDHAPGGKRVTGSADEMPAGVGRGGHASTCRTLGYVHAGLGAGAGGADGICGRLRWPAGRLASVKGLAAAVLRLVLGWRSAGTPENAAVNR